MTLRVFLAAVKRHWKTFAITAVVVLAVGLLWLVLTPAKYVSTTRMMVSVEGATTAAAYENAQVVAGRVNTYIALLTSEVVDQRVIDKLKLPESPQELAGKVNATIVPPRTSLIDIAVTDESADRARSIAQTLADEFVKFADAMETPTGDDGQKVHTTIVTSATAPHQQRAERVALGGLVALAALVLGAVAVWIRSANDPALRKAKQDAAAASAPPTQTTTPTPPRTVPVTAPVPQTAALDAATADVPPTTTTAPAQPRTVPVTAPVPQTAALDAATADVPPTQTTAPTPPRTVDVLEGYRRLQARLRAITDRLRRTGGVPPTKTTAPVQPRTIDVLEGYRRLQAQLRSLTDRLRRTGGVPPTKTTAPVQPRTIDVLEGYRRLQAQLRSLTDRSRRTWAARRVTRRGQQPDAAASVAHTATQPRAHLEAAKPQERTPWLLGFLCLLTPMMCAYVVPAGPLKSNGSPAKVIAVLFFGLAVLGFLLVRRTASTRTFRPGVAIILVYFLLQLLVYGIGVTHTGSALVEANKTRAVINLVAHVGVALYVLARVQTPRQRNIVLGCLATGLTFACVVGLLQSLTNIDFRFFIQPPGFVINTEDLEMGTRWGVKRVLGTSQHAIEFSMLAALAVPLTMHFARYAANRQVRWAALLACGLALVAMPAGGSRTGVVALAAILLVYMWNFKVRQIAAAIAVGSVMILGYVFVLPATAYALWAAVTEAREDASISTRIADYAQVGETFRANPVFGLGLGADPPSEYGLLDNEWLQAIVQGGTLGIVAMMVLVVGSIFGITAALRRATNPRERDQAYMLGSMIVAILVCTFTFDLFSFLQVTGVFFVIFGLLWTNFTIQLPEASARGPSPVAVQPAGRVEVGAAAAR